MLDRAAQALKDWRLHAKALTDYREGKISLAEARCRPLRQASRGLQEGRHHLQIDDQPVVDRSSHPRR
jgi:hypothetical protein